MLGAEAAIHRKGAGDIAVVVAVGATGINQQQIAILQLAVVFHVMQDAGVFPGSDDRRVSRPPTTTRSTKPIEFRLHFIFPNAGPGHLHSPLVGLGGDVGRLAHGRQFQRRFNVPQLVQAGDRVFEGYRAAPFAEIAPALLFPQIQNLRIEVGIMTQAIENAIARLQVLRQLGG